MGLVVVTIGVFLVWIAVTGRYKDVGKALKGG
jgi:hypothetical protein